MNSGELNDRVRAREIRSQTAGSAPGSVRYSSNASAVPIPYGDHTSSANCRIAPICFLKASWYAGFPVSAQRCMAATVSYTHLRAHETDSYLVCRLLLE